MAGVLPKHEFQSVLAVDETIVKTPEKVEEKVEEKSALPPRNKSSKNETKTN
jgi:hypothetical protein